jgi:cysteine desulfurase
MRAPIYLDYNATTPVAPEAADAVLVALTERFGNPSSEHAFGWAADESVEQARENVGAVINGDPRAITFTSGATEAINLALVGAGNVYGGRKHHVVTIATEHKAVLETCAAMERDGFMVTVLPVRGDGSIDLDLLRATVTDKTMLVAAMWANNETGVVHPIAEIAAIAHEHGALVMTDATQAIGKVPVDVREADVDLLALSGHKFYAPKGVGALYIRRRGPRVRLSPLVHGGGHEEGLRAGTLNVPGIVGMGVAADIAARRTADDARRLSAMRDRFERDLTARLEGVHVNGGGAERLPNTSSLRFDGVPPGRLMPALRGLAVSTGSACQARTSEPSHVLAAMGLDRDQAARTVRFSLGRPTTEADMSTAAEEVVDAVLSLRRRAAAA